MGKHPFNLNENYTLLYLGFDLTYLLNAHQYMAW